MERIHICLQDGCFRIRFVHFVVRVEWRRKVIQQNYCSASSGGEQLGDNNMMKTMNELQEICAMISSEKLATVESFHSMDTWRALLGQ